MCCVRWLMPRTPTFAPECCGHLSSHAGSSQTRLVYAGLIYWAQRSLFYSSLPQPLTHTLIHAENPHPEGPKREMAPVIFPLLTGTLQHSLSQSPRGDDIKQRKKPFTFYSLLPQRAHISFLTLSILFFIHFSRIPPIYPSLSLYSLHLFLYFIKFDILTTHFKYQHQKIPPLCIFWSKQRSSSYRVGVIFQWNNLPPQIWSAVCGKYG